MVLINYRVRTRKDKFNYFLQRSTMLHSTNLTLTYLDALTQQELQVIAVARPYVAVEDYYGNTFLCGAENGMELTGGTVTTGAAAGDLSGFTLVMEGMEETAPYFLTAAIVGSGEQIDPTA